MTLESASVFSCKVREAKGIQDSQNKEMQVHMEIDLLVSEGPVSLIVSPQHFVSFGLALCCALSKQVYLILFKL